MDPHAKTESCSTRPAEPTEEHVIADGPLNAIAELAALALGVPIATISVITGVRERFGFFGPSDAVGNEVTTFCRHLAKSTEPLVVPDVLQDSRFADDLQVAGAHVRFCAGVPLHDASGRLLGTFAVLDRCPRRASERDLRQLQLLANQVLMQLELELVQRERQRARAALVGEERNLQAVFDAMAEGVVLVDGERHVTSFNRAARRILGVTDEQLKGALRTAPINEPLRADGSHFPTDDWPLTRAQRSGEISSKVVMGLRAPSGDVTWVSVNAAPITAPTESGSLHPAVATFHDITDLLRAQSALLQSEASFRALLGSAPVGVSVVVAGRLRYVNASLLSLLAYDDARDLLEKAPEAFVHASSREAAEARFRALDEMAIGAELPATVIDCVKRTGELVSVEFTTVVIELQGERATVALARDVTEQRRAEASRERAEAALRRSLREKETLLKEVHHRVKNNLQVIISLLNLQSRKITDEHLGHVFEVTRGRVRAIALLHERLYRSDDVSSIDLLPYLTGLTDDVMRAHAELARSIGVSVTGDEIHTTMDAAICVGLIVNELLTNALKHAFHGRELRKNIIRVSVRQDGEDVELEVSDNGAGRPPCPATKSGLGLSLVRTLASQLDGTVAELDSDGFACVIRSRLPRFAAPTPHEHDS